MHSVWLGLVVPIMVFLVWAYPALRARRIWLICLVVASLAIAGLIGFDLQQSLARGGKSGASFQQGIYTILTMTDLPLIAFWIGSVVNVLCCSWMSQTTADSGDLEMVEPKIAQLGNSVEL